MSGEDEDEDRPGLGCCCCCCCCIRELASGIEAVAGKVACANGGGESGGVEW